MYGMYPTLTNTGRKLKRGIPCGPRQRYLPAVFLMTDEARLPRPETTLSTLPRGAGVIFRHYADPDRQNIGIRLSRICRARGLRLLVGGSWQLAAQVGAHGLHLPTHMAAAGLAPAARLWLRQRKGLLTVAAHGSNDLRQARKIGAAAALLSPIFPTASHPGQRPLGPMRCAAMVRDTTVAVIALGGVTAKTINALRGTGCRGIAGISFVSENQS